MIQSYRQSDRYKDLMYDCGLRETEDGRVIHDAYFQLLRRITRMVNFTLCEKNLETLVAIKPKEQLDRLVAKARMLVAKANAVDGAEKDAELVQVGRQLEDVVIQARGGRRNPKLSIENLLAGLSMAA